MAALAGVSKAAVSRSFNGAERISPATVSRIRAAAAELGWLPNSAARAINGAPAHAVGVVIRRDPELLDADPFFPAFFAGVGAALKRHGFALTVRFVSSAADERACYHQLAAEGRVDGFLVNDIRRNDRRFAVLRGLHARAVVVGSPGPSCPFPSVDTDSTGSVRRLVTHLVEQGHQVIAHVCGPADLLHARAREQTWREVLAAYRQRPGPVVIGDFSARGGAAATRQVLASCPDVSAIFYANDVMAIAGMAALQELGVRTPQDVAVAGFDDIVLSSYSSPPLSTVHCDYRLLGRTAAELLLGNLTDAAPPVHVDLPSEVRLRRSTGD